MWAVRSMKTLRKDLEMNIFKYYKRWQVVAISGNCRKKAILCAIHSHGSLICCHMAPVSEPADWEQAGRSGLCHIQHKWPKERSILTAETKDASRGWTGCWCLQTNKRGYPKGDSARGNFIEVMKYWRGRTLMSSTSSRKQERRVEQCPGGGRDKGEAELVTGTGFPEPGDYRW